MISLYVREDVMNVLVSSLCAYLYLSIGLPLRVWVLLVLINILATFY